MNSEGMRILIQLGQLLATEALRDYFHGKFRRKCPVNMHCTKLIPAK